MAKKAKKKKLPARTASGRFKKGKGGTQVSMFKGTTIKRKRKKGVKRTKRGAAADRKRSAMPAGTRISRTGRKYSERRANRAD